MIDYKYNHTDLNGCSCHCHPPCSFCVDTFTCDSCNNREYSAESEERPLGFICENCIVEQSVYIAKDQTVFVSGNPSIKITNVKYKDVI